MQRLAALTAALGTSFFLFSCESTDSRRAGGAAFGDTPMERNLDGNGLVPDQEDLAGDSVDAWREIRE